MNAAKSNFGQFPAPSKNTMTVEQNSTTIKVTQVMNTPNGDFTMSQDFGFLDGKPTAGSGFGRSHHLHHGEAGRRGTFARPRK